MGQNTKHIIGIAGNALVGKDTICNAMITTFGDFFKLKATRRSIAGDQVRKDLKSLFSRKFGINIQSPTNEEKTLLRPIMVEYGIAQRKKTDGRYFIDRYVPSEFIDIVPDIRYALYEKDELQWITQEVGGFLIYLERDGILPANIYEEENNKIIKEKAHFVVNIPTFTQEELPITILPYAKSVIDEWFKFVKV
jgi:hypothetical protein